MNRIYIGIDPGKSGALAFICGDSMRAYPFELDTYREELELAGYNDCVCCLERVHSMPTDSNKTAFSFGENFGIIQEILHSKKIPFQMVEPSKWKRDFGVTADKNSSIEVCKRLFPGVSLLRTPQCRKEHDGMAEALLLAEYARRHF